MMPKGIFYADLRLANCLYFEVPYRRNSTVGLYSRALESETSLRSVINKKLKIFIVY
jgi:hypothetical protein